MGMRLRLREYKAHPVEDPKERAERWNRVKALLAMVLGIAAPIVVVVSLTTRGQPVQLRAADKLKLERLAAAQATSPYIVRSAYPEFLYHNWGHLSASDPEGAVGGEAQNPGPDPTVPEAYQELRGLAVYEVPEGAPPTPGRIGASGISPATQDALEAAKEARTGKTRGPSNSGGGR